MDLRFTNNGQGGALRTQRVKPYLPALKLHLTKGNLVILIGETWIRLMATTVNDIHGGIFPRLYSNLGLER